MVLRGIREQKLDKKIDNQESKESQGFEKELNKTTKIATRAVSIYKFVQPFTISNEDFS